MSPPTFLAQSLPNNSFKPKPLRGFVQSCRCCCRVGSPSFTLRFGLIQALGLIAVHRYYFIDSNGEDTNLQLYSLKQAKLYWAALERDLAESKEVEHFHERCVICTMGLSVSQLLGQNNPQPNEWVPPPSTIFNSLVDHHGLDPSLKGQFNDFISVYDQCRHFGLTSNGDRHSQVSQVTLDKTRALYSFGLLVWETVIGVFRRDPASELDDLSLEGVENEP